MDNGAPFVARAPLANMLAPALGYNTLSTNPPHVQLTLVGNNYLGGEGSPEIALWDFVGGRSYAGEAFQQTPLYHNYEQGAGYQFSAGNIVGAFPRRGLQWSFDFWDCKGCTGQWPFFMDRASYSASVVACESTIGCGTEYANLGTQTSTTGIQENTNGGEYASYWSTRSATSNLLSTAVAPTWMAGNSSYSVVGVYRLNATTLYSNYGGIWNTGAQGASNSQSVVALNQVSGVLNLDWGIAAAAHYRWPSSFTMTQGNWYFIAVTVAATTGCGSNCTPDAHIWVADAGEVSDYLAGQSYTAIGGATVKTPAVTSSPFRLGISPDLLGQNKSGMSYATLMVYDRPLSVNEVRFMYRSMRTQMEKRGVTLR